MFNTNTWNRIRYTIYTPFYDGVAALFNRSRRLSVDSLQIQPGASVLLIGAGTGLDLPYFPANCRVVATDLTPAMIARVKKRADRLNRPVEALVMDGHHLDFPDASFDHVVLHLILAVIPDPDACLRETVRVLKPGGTVAVFDKFVGRNQKPTILRRLLNLPSAFLATHLTRQAESLLSPTGLEILSDTDADAGGLFRRILLRKPQP